MKVHKNFLKWIELECIKTMKNLLDIYKETYEIENFEIDETREVKKICLFYKKNKIGEIFLPSFFSTILIILPGAGFNEKVAKNILNQFKFLLKNNIGICIFNLKNGNLKKSDNEFLKFFKDKVAEIKGIIKFIEKNLEIKNISILGISFGGIIGFVVSAIEEKINECIFLISGVDIELLTWRSFLRFYIKKDCLRITCRRMHNIYKKFIENKMYEEIKNLPRKCFLYDPLTYLERLKNKKILMINGIFDLIVPFYCALAVKKKIKNVKILWYPGTHFTFRFFFPFMKNKILNFIKNGILCRN